MPDVCFVSELYYPEETSTGALLTGIAEGLASHFPTIAVCSRPTYAQRGLDVPWRETHGGVRIIRCRATRFNPHKLVSRAVNAVTISASMFFKLLRVLKRGTVAIVVTNPPMLPFVTRVACRIRGARCVLLVHDVYPEALVVAGMIAPAGKAYRLLSAIARRLYRSMDHVIAIGRDMARLVEKKGARAVTIIPNWTDTGVVRHVERTNREPFVLLYGGNIGRTHDAGTLLDAAAALRSDPAIELRIIGSGAGRGDVERDIAARGLHNVRLLPAVSRADFLPVLYDSDISIVSMRAGMSGISVPSRLYNIMAAGRPVIALADEDSEIAMVLREEEIGWLVPPGDVAALVRTIIEAKSDPARLDAMGRRARAAAERKYALPYIVEQYARLIERVGRG